MDNPWAFALMIGAAVAMLASWKTPRAWLWIGIGGLSFVSSSLYWDFGDPLWHPPFTFLCDALVCLCFHLWAQERWELGCFGCFLTSCFVSIVMLTGWIPSTVLYGSILEVCNWAALFIIGGVGLTDLVKANERTFVGRLHSRLHSPRTALR